MKLTVLQYLEEIAEKFPNKIAYEDIKEKYSFKDVEYNAKKIGSYIASVVGIQKPIVVYMEKGANNIIAFMGAAYAGCFYVPLDNHMPLERINIIIDTLKPELIIYDDFTANDVEFIHGNIDRVHYNVAVNYNLNEVKLDSIRKQSKNTDIIYVLFTSGSTGVPKGVTISHIAVIDFMEWICQKYSLDEETSLCNQAPFYFDASMPDIFIPFYTGATVYIPPKSYYSFPKKVLQYIEKNSINTLIWVPSALCNVVKYKAFDVCVPKTVRLVIFCGEVMPCKYLNTWIKYMPETKYVNMYGPTEATYACMYYDIDRDFSDCDVLPLGKACENSKILLLSDNNQLSVPGEIGEICVLGVCLSNGYYGAPDKTSQVFVQNPTNLSWKEMMYRTGDLGHMNSDGEIIFDGRKDFQIKRLGHRIELGEIENNILSMDGIDSACCIYDEDKSLIIALYVGEKGESDILHNLKNHIPQYMIPNEIYKLNDIPLNINGKMDRVKLKHDYEGGLIGYGRND